MLTCDVLIVGGGPAGSTCAWKLRQAGLDVMVIDAAQFPRDKVCAGWITPHVLAELDLDTEAYARQRTFQPFDGFRVGLINRREGTRVGYDRHASFGIRRCEFDHYLLQRSAARLALGTAVTTIRRDGEAWVVNDAIRTPMLVGAGGSGCPVARMLNGVVRGRPLVVAREAESRVSEAFPIEASVPELFFCRDLKGYGWCVRKGEYLNVGLGRLDPRSLPEATAQFVAFLEASHRIPIHVSWRWRGHSYAVHAAPHQRVVDAGVVLAGDAAGVADPESGEGIRQAIESGLLAARTIVEARGCFSRDRLEPYLSRLSRRLATTAPAGSAGLARLVPERVKTAMAGYLLDVPAFVKHVVLDEWFLHRRQPPLQH